MSLGSAAGSLGSLTGRWRLSTRASGCNKSQPRHKENLSQNPQNDSWVITQKWQRLYSPHRTTYFLCQKENLTNVGVFVDYKEGFVSFYEPQSVCLLGNLTPISVCMLKKMLPLLTVSNYGCGSLCELVCVYVQLLLLYFFFKCHVW